MILILKNDHKQNLSLLMLQPIPVLQDFCKLALEYIQKGPNPKLYNVAAQKLDVQVESIRGAVEGLVFLLVESCRNEVAERAGLQGLGAGAGLRRGPPAAAERGLRGQEGGRALRAGPADPQGAPLPRPRVEAGRPAGVEGTAAAGDPAGDHEAVAGLGPAGLPADGPRQPGARRRGPGGGAAREPEPALAPRRPQLRVSRRSPPGTCRTVTHHSSPNDTGRGT
ncbi:atherin-like isoform X1 [Bacillus rossius redtenbacheri]|uniref:atherin-like isoform X1 n=1 Tax=Bacillus rossius redtenbacheri TaxID=93214 RepID=UPI002FDE6DC0